MSKKVLVGISGGIDSAVTALQLKQEGFEVLGVHLQMVEEPLELQLRINQIAGVLQIEIPTLDCREAFQNIVIDAFRLGHLAGNTPSPCSTCNPQLKWQLLQDTADQYGIEYIATGHYIQTVQDDGLWYLKKGNDPLKDQSYFLWGLDQKVLPRIITPLGTLTKQEVRQIAQLSGLQFLDKQKESTGLCFAQGLGYADLIRKYIPESVDFPKGPVVDQEGFKIGEHNGYLYYTIGQKKDIFWYHVTDKALCIVKIIPETNTLVAGLPESLWNKEFYVNNCRIINEKLLLESNEIEVKVRGYGLNPDGFASIVKTGPAQYHVTLKKAAWAMAPGQPVVFYHQNMLLGGGICQ
ncbi:MAG: tRNA 2-thiouridine(34) synthase MnmA [Bacteroidota bacterium]|nr:MAG: tRNA 2-thiouridine(34) synthase MnmA [Bacteroidota bacterium]